MDTSANFITLHRCLLVIKYFWDRLFCVPACCTREQLLPPPNCPLVTPLSAGPTEQRVQAPHALRLATRPAVCRHNLVQARFVKLTVFVQSSTKSMNAYSCSSIRNVSSCSSRWPESLLLILSQASETRTPLCNGLIGHCTSGRPLNPPTIGEDSMHRSIV